MGEGDAIEPRNDNETVARIESEIAALRQRLAAIRDREDVASLEAAKLYSEARRTVGANAAPASLEDRVRASGLFDPAVYLELHPDIPRGETEAWHHFLRYGLRERRAFTNPIVVARLLAQMDLRRAARILLARRGPGLDGDCSRPGLRSLQCRADPVSGSRGIFPGARSGSIQALRRGACPGRDERS